MIEKYGSKKIEIVKDDNCKVKNKEVLINQNPVREDDNLNMDNMEIMDDLFKTFISRLNNMNLLYNKKKIVQPNTQQMNQYIQNML
jgi:hypothetical protein